MFLFASTGVDGYNFVVDLYVPGIPIKNSQIKTFTGLIKNYYIWIVENAVSRLLDRAANLIFAPISKVVTRFFNAFLADS